MHPSAGIMLVALIPALLAVALFVGTLTLKPQRARTTLLPPRPAAR
jgi:hypothetical protein